MQNFVPTPLNIVGEEGSVDLAGTYQLILTGNNVLLFFPWVRQAEFHCSHAGISLISNPFFSRGMRVMESKTGRMYPADRYVTMINLSRAADVDSDMEFNLHVRQPIDSVKIMQIRATSHEAARRVYDRLNTVLPVLLTKIRDDWDNCSQKDSPRVLPAA